MPEMKGPFSTRVRTRTWGGKSGGHAELPHRRIPLLLMVLHPAHDVIQRPYRPQHTESEEPRQASLPDLFATKAKQTSATVTLIEDARVA
jgi:hypothetical protein